LIPETTASHDETRTLEERHDAFPEGVGFGCLVGRVGFNNRRDLVVTRRSGLVAAWGERRSRCDSCCGRTEWLWTV